VDLVPADLPVLTNLGGEPGARDWIRDLPALISAVRDEFGVTLAAPLHGGSCSWVAPATMPDGTAAILKIGWPHREMLGEPAALRHWNGDGAVRLLGHDPARHALLLARCVPGVELGRTDAPAADRLRIGAAILRRLWAAPPPAELERLADVTAEWATLAEDRLNRLHPSSDPHLLDLDPGLVAEGIGLLRSLPSSGGREVLLHGDLNPGNILSTGDGWLAIDPKPMRGDAAYDPWRLLQQIDNPFSYAFPATRLRERVAILAHELSLPAERMVAWSLARQVETALYLANRGIPAEAAEALAEARILADL
jgi:streptomycin 6-kinase